MALKKKAKQVVKEGVKVTLMGLGALAGETLAESLFKEEKPKKKKEGEDESNAQM